MTIRSSAALLVLFGITSATACSGSKRSTSDSAASASTASTPAATPSTTPSADSQAASSASSSAAAADPHQFTDANILAVEATGDSVEVVVATLAKQKAASAGVKQYASQLVSDHSKGLRETHAVAKAAGITPAMPAGDTTVQSTEHVMQRLQGMTGAAFDSAFVNHEVDDHRQDIDEAKAMSGAAKAPQVKALVDKSLPELQKHLNRAEQLRKGR